MRAAWFSVSFLITSASTLVTFVSDLRHCVCFCVLFHSDFGTTSSSGSASERLSVLQHGRSTFPDQLSGDKFAGSHSTGEPFTRIKLCTSNPCIPESCSLSCALCRFGFLRVCIVAPLCFLSGVDFFLSCCALFSVLCCCLRHVLLSLFFCLSVLSPMCLSVCFLYACCCVRVLSLLLCLFSLCDAPSLLCVPVLSLFCFCVCACALLSCALDRCDSLVLSTCSVSVLLFVLSFPDFCSILFLSVTCCVVLPCYRPILCLAALCRVLSASVSLVVCVSCSLCVS
eukprot:SAG11_NODE_6345_length_1331_cov_4.003247_2_plen_284_part_00